MKRGTWRPRGNRTNRDLTFDLSGIRFTKVDVSGAFDTKPAPERSKHRNGPRSRKAKAHA